MTGVDAVMVREAELADAERIARVHVESWRETYSGVLNDRYLAVDPRPGQMSVAAQNGSIIGFANAGASVGPDAEHGFPAARSKTLFSIYLLAASHGAGVGQALLDAVVGRDQAQLWVLRENARAITFYRRNGFDFDGTEYVDPADPNLVELRMVH
jgi:ribosomal protein S18 acetylase RimI-like enzyme